MKILIALSSWYPDYTASSIGKVTYHICTLFRKNGIDVDICAPIGGNINVINPNYLKLTKGFQPINYFYRMIYFWLKTIVYIRSNYGKYDLFLIHNPNPLIWRFTNKNIYGNNIYTKQPRWKYLQLKNTPEFYSLFLMLTGNLPFLYRQQYRKDIEE